MSGTIAFADLPRLSGMLPDGEGEVTVSLHLGADDEGYRTITGGVVTGLRLECQRCLEPVSFRVDAPVSLAMVWREDEMASLPARYEGVVVGQEPADLYEIVEEEILLALPLVALHDTAECRSTVPVSADPARDSEEAKKSPFSVLRSLRPKKG